MSWQMSRVGKKTLASEAQHLVYVQDIVRVADGEGGHSEDWRNREPQVWASINPIMATERAEYQTRNVNVTHRIKIRGRVEIDDTGSNRILWNGRQFRIQTAEDIQERGVMKFLTCEEVRNLGEAL